MKYALTRIRAVQRTGQTFKPARPFDIDAELAPALGAFNKKDAQPVHVRFSKDVGIFILERPWHKKQETLENADGPVDVKLNVSLTPELDAILLPWAGHMRVLSPASLIGRMRAAGEALMRDHPDDSDLDVGS